MIRYIVSNEYQQSSLKDLINEFSSFNEILSKKYLNQIILGL